MRHMNYYKYNTDSFKKPNIKYETKMAFADSKFVIWPISPKGKNINFKIPNRTSCSHVS